MRFDTGVLLTRAHRLCLDGFLGSDTYERRRSTLSTLEGQLALKDEHVAAYEESRGRLVLDGTSLAWERWQAEQRVLTLFRAEVARIESVIRLEVEMLEREVALAQQRRARSLGGGKEALA